MVEEQDLQHQADGKGGEEACEDGHIFRSRAFAAVPRPFTRAYGPKKQEAQPGEVEGAANCRWDGHHV